MTVRDLPRVGETLEAALAAGANRVHSLGFDLADKDDARHRARAAAVADARRKAEEYATLTGVRLGGPLTIKESSSPLHFQRFSTASAPDPTPILSGANVISLAVEITYELW